MPSERDFTAQIEQQKRKITIVEVSARDGIQNESVNFNTQEKIRLIEQSVAAGIRRLETCSFVNPLRVPQMADALEVMDGLSPQARRAAIGLVLNERGLDRALEAGLRQINYVVVVSETFSQKNQGISVRDNLSMLAKVVQRAKEAAISVSVTLSAAFGCPFEGEVSVESLIEVVQRVAETGPDEIALADTVGAAVPPMVSERIGLTQEVIGAMTDLRCHFHNTRNTGLANAYAAVLAGVSILDSSIGGIGGCPFAPRATGNIATEDLAFMLERSGYSTGLDFNALFSIADWLAIKLGKELPAMVSRAGLFP